MKKTPPAFLGSMPFFIRSLSLGVKNSTADKNRKTIPANLNAMLQPKEGMLPMQTISDGKWGSKDMLREFYTKLDKPVIRHTKGRSRLSVARFQ